MTPPRRIDRVPSSTEPTVFRLTYRMADSLRWRRQYDEEMLRGLHARPMTRDDQYVIDVSITDIYTRGDTLIGRYTVGDARDTFGCPQ